MIHNALFSNEINFEFYETKGQLDALNKAMTFEIDNYSALALVGGDGTIHEGINGLMRRKDGKKLPVAFIPNGTGDDTCGSFGIDIGDIN